MKILHLSEPIYPFVQGGLASHTHQMAQRQTEQGHDVTVLATTNGDVTDGEIDADYERVIKPEQARVFGARISLGALNWVRRRAGDFDVVHAHSHLYFTTNLAALRNVVRSGPPLVITNHGTYAFITPVLAKAHFRIFGTPTYRAADRTICYNEHAREILTGVGVEDIEIVPNGIDVEQFSPPEERDFGRGPILWSGRMEEGKGAVAAIRAMQHIVAERPNLELHLYGDGDLREEAESTVAELGLSENVEFKGYVSQEELVEALRDSRLYLAPTDYYTFGRGIMEAIACGIPTFSTNLPSDTSIGTAGVPITQQPRAAAATVLEYIDEPEELEVIAERGRAVIEKNHDFTKHIDQVTAICRELIEE